MYFQFRGLPSASHWIVVSSRRARVGIAPGRRPPAGIRPLKEALEGPEKRVIIEALQAHGVGTIIHYPVPVHLQPAYADLGYQAGSLPVTERWANEVLSLPLYPGLGADAVQAVAAAVAECTEEVRLAS